MGDLELFVFWFITCLASVSMEISLGYRMVKDLADNGYKFKSKFHNEFNKNDQKSTKKRKIKLLKFIPIVNIFYAFYMAFEYFEHRNALYEGLYTMGLLEELSEFEEKEYKKNPTGFNAVVLFNTVEQKLRTAPYIVVTVNYEKGKIYYEINTDTAFPLNDEDINILKVEDSATYLSLNDQKERILQYEKECLFNRIEKDCIDSDLNLFNADNNQKEEVFSYNSTQELSNGKQKEVLKQLKNELLQQNVLEDTNNDSEKSSVIIRKRKK